MWILLISCFTLVIHVNAEGYDVSVSPTSGPVLDSTTNIRCRVTGTDTSTQDSVIVWYQERDVYEALDMVDDGRARQRRVVAACRNSVNENGQRKSVYLESEMHVPERYREFSASHIKKTVCTIDRFNLQLVYSGMPHIGEWWCYYTKLDGPGAPLINITKNGAVPADDAAIMAIRAKGGKISFYPTAPDPDRRDGKAGLVLGHQGTLPCTADTSDLTNPRFFWSLKNGARLNKFTVNQTSGSLMISKVPDDIEDTYVCTAESGGNSTNGTVNVVTYKLPQPWIHVETNEFISFSSVKDDIVQTMVFYAKKPSGLAEVVDSYTLAFPAGKNDLRFPISFGREYEGGVFYIKFYAYLPGVIPFPYITRSLDYKIQVPYPMDSVALQPTTSLTHIRTVEGHSTDLQCTALGGGHPPKMIYFNQIQTDGLKRPLGAKGLGAQWVAARSPRTIYSRSLEVFDRQDNGTRVQCEAEGENGTMLNSTLLLEVYWLPDVLNFTITPERPLVPEGTVVTLTCTTSGGYPDNVTLQWKYGDASLQVPGNVLTLDDVTDDNSGRYSCTAINKAGVMSKEIYLAVQRKPLTLRDSIGPLILVILASAAVAGLVAAFFLFFMIRGSPDKRKPDKKSNRAREPRFRPTPEEKAQKKNNKKKSAHSPAVPNDVTNVKNSPQANHTDVTDGDVKNGRAVQDQEDVVDVDHVTVDMAPTSGPLEVEADINQTIDASKFLDHDLKYADEDSDVEVTKL